MSQYRYDCDTEDPSPNESSHDLPNYCASWRGEESIISLEEQTFSVFGCSKAHFSFLLGQKSVIGWDGCKEKLRRSMFKAAQKLAHEERLIRLFF
jgi:hypothetical protein